MANYRKSFNFRSGVQVDNDRLIVDGRGNVGIGTSIPSRELDVYGSTRLNGSLESNTLNVSGVSTFSSAVTIGSSVNINPSSGIISAVSFRGDGSLLNGVLAIATVGWVANAGTLSTSLSVGIGTTNPVYLLQVGGNPSNSSGVGIGTQGNVYISGVTTVGTLGVSGLTTTQNLQVTGVSTIGTLRVSGLTTTQNLQVTGVSTIGTLGVSGLTTTQNLRVTGVSTIGTLGVSGLTTTQNLQVSGVSTIGSLGVSGITTTQNLQVAGVSTISTLLVTGSTITQNLQVSGVSTLGIVTSGNIFSTGVITATTFFGSFVGSISTAQSLSGTPDLNVGVLTASAAFISGNTLSALSNGNVGIGTTNPTKDLQIKKSGATSLEVISDTSTSTIAIGKSVGLGNSSAAIIYDSGLLKINNYDLGGVEFNLHEGTGAGITDGFRVRYNSATLLDVTHEGKLGVNVSDPDYNLQVNGTAYVSGNAEIVGILTIGTGGSKIVLDPIGGSSIIPFPTSQNFNITSGLSTFYNFKTTGYVEAGLGITARQSSIFESKVAINTSTFSTIDPSNSYKLIVSGATRSTGDISFSGRIGINTDGSFYSDPRVIPNVEPFSSEVPYFSYGDVQMVTQGGASVVTQNIILVPQIGVATVGFGTTNGGLKPGGSFDANKYLTTIGINTYFARGILDVGTASTTMNSYFIPPSLTQDELDIVSTLWNSPTRTGYATARRVTPNGVPPGAIVYNKTAGQLQVGIGSTTFVGLATVGASVGGSIPVGGIIMWSGSIASIPSGWGLCDGTNGTPDLRNRFIVGAGTDTLSTWSFNKTTGVSTFTGGQSYVGVGSTGGRVGVALTVGDLASHNHSISPSTLTGRGGAFSATAGGQPLSEETVTIGNTGGDLYHENRPPYYALAYIMRTS